MPVRRSTTAIASITASVIAGTTAVLSLGVAPASAASVATWDKVAQCESSGNWSINTGNGYYGGLQFSASTWRAFGGSVYAAYAHQATKKQQILIAEKVLAKQGPGAWPSCGRSAGLGSDHTNPYPDVPTPPAPAQSWKAQVLVESGSGLYHAARFDDGTWTRFGNVAGEASGLPGGVQDIAEAGINGDTHVLAVNDEGKLFHTIRAADRTWGGFGNVHAAAGVLGNVTQVDAVSVGAELHVAVVADGVVRHTVRHADGSWQPFGTVGKPGEAPVTKVALARTGDEVQLVAVAGGVVHHKLRKADASWTGWGVPSTAAGLTGVGDVAIAGTGGDLQLIVTASNGTKQYHGVRYANGTWTSFNSLTSVISGVTVTDVAAAAVDGELQVGLVATDGRILHTIRHANATWDNPGSIDLTGVTGDHTGIALTATFN